MHMVLESQLLWSQYLQKILLNLMKQVQVSFFEFSGELFGIDVQHSIVVPVI